MEGEEVIDSKCRLLAIRDADSSNEVLVSFTTSRLRSYDGRVRGCALVELKLWAVAPTVEWACEEDASPEPEGPWDPRLWGGQRRRDFVHKVVLVVGQEELTLVVNYDGN